MKPHNESKPDKIKLTERGEKALARLKGVLAVLALTGAVVAGCNVLDDSGSNERQDTETYIVKEGDTLWDIASSINSDETGEIVTKIKKLNPEVFSDSTTIQPGQPLTVPAG
jgi:nucleoid-associated protein YgaU